VVVLSRKGSQFQYIAFEGAIKMRIRQASRFLAKGMEASLINLIDLPGKE
jgi:hypothetical protein